MKTIPISLDEVSSFCRLINEILGNPVDRIYDREIQYHIHRPYLKANRETAKYNLHYFMPTFNVNFDGTGTSIQVSETHEERIMMVDYVEVFPRRYKLKTEMGVDKAKADELNAKFKADSLFYCRCVRHGFDAVVDFYKDGVVKLGMGASQADVETNVFTLTKYASKIGVPPDKMYMVEKWEKNLLANYDMSGWKFYELRGRAITEAYKLEVGGESCMRGGKAEALCEFYAMNPATISLALMIPPTQNPRPEDCIRALIWRTKSGNIVIDRAYGPNRDEKQDLYVGKLMIEVGLRNPGVQISSCYRGPRLLPDVLKDVVVARVPISGCMPYLDTHRCVWSPTDDPIFMVSEGFTYKHFSPLLKDASRVIYLSTGEDAINAEIEKELEHKPKYMPLIKAARQTDAGPFAELSEEIKQTLDRMWINSPHKKRSVKSLTTMTVDEIGMLPDPIAFAIEEQTRNMSTPSQDRRLLINALNVLTNDITGIFNVNRQTLVEDQIRNSRYAHSYALERRRMNEDPSLMSLLPFIYGEDVPVEPPKAFVPEDLVVEAAPVGAAA